MRILIWIIVFLLSGCEKIALMTTPKKHPQASHNQLAKLAENQFWDSLHSGNYQNIPEISRLLTAAYLENPNDPKLAAHLGFTHIWKITERARNKQIPPDIVNEIILAKKYFSDAYELNPEEARILGFLGDSILIEGKIFHDERQQVHAYFMLKQAISMWPEFNYFTAGYPMSTLDPHSKSYQEALDWQWKTLDLCAGAKVDRNNPDFRPYLVRETKEGPLRACWNSWIAPHNFEGFFLNMGDMLVKQGQWQTAVKIYQNASLSKEYSDWPYRKILEHRIQQAKENVKNFQDNNSLDVNKTLIFNSGYGCMVCHQNKKPA